MQRISSFLVTILIMNMMIPTMALARESSNHRKTPPSQERLLPDQSRRGEGATGRYDPLGQLLVIEEKAIDASKRYYDGLDEAYHAYFDNVADVVIGKLSVAHPEVFQLAPSTPEKKAPTFDSMINSGNLQMKPSADPAGALPSADDSTMTENLQDSEGSLASNLGQDTLNDPSQVDMKKTGLPLQLKENDVMRAARRELRLLEDESDTLNTMIVDQLGTLSQEQIESYINLRVSTLTRRMVGRARSDITQLRRRIDCQGDIVLDRSIPMQIEKTANGERRSAYRYLASIYNQFSCISLNQTLRLGYAVQQAHEMVESDLVGNYLHVDSDVMIPHDTFHKVEGALKNYSANALNVYLLIFDQIKGYGPTSWLSFLRHHVGKYAVEIFNDETSDLHQFGVYMPHDGTLELIPFTQESMGNMNDAIPVVGAMYEGQAITPFGVPIQSIKNTQCDDGIAPEPKPVGTLSGTLMDMTNPHMLGMALLDSSNTTVHGIADTTFICGLGGSSEGGGGGGGSVNVFCATPSTVSALSDIGSCAPALNAWPVLPGGGLGDPTPLSNQGIDATSPTPIMEVGVDVQQLKANAICGAILSETDDDLLSTNWEDKSFDKPDGNFADDKTTEDIPEPLESYVNEEDDPFPKDYIDFDFLVDIYNENDGSTYAKPSKWWQDGNYKQTYHGSNNTEGSMVIYQTYWDGYGQMTKDDWEMTAYAKGLLTTDVKTAMMQMVIQMGKQGILPQNVVDLITGKQGSEAFELAKKMLLAFKDGDITETHPGALGYYTYGTGVIHILPSQSGYELAETLLHEFVHMWMDLSGVHNLMWTVPVSSPLMVTGPDGYGVYKNEITVDHLITYYLGLGISNGFPNPMDSFNVCTAFVMGSAGSYLNCSTPTFAEVNDFCDDPLAYCIGPDQLMGDSSGGDAGGSWDGYTPSDPLPTPMECDQGSSNPICNPTCITSEDSGLDFNMMFLWMGGGWSDPQFNEFLIQMGGAGGDGDPY